jgi:uncharacterized protein YrrD
MIQGGGEMLKAKSVAGKEVMSREEAEKVATVKDLIVSQDYKSIAGVLVDAGGLFGPAKVVPISKVVSFGNDVVVISNNEAVVTIDEEPQIKESLDHKDKLIRKKVYTERGDMQARVNDVYFDESTWAITGFELAGDLFKSSPGGIVFLPAEDVISIGPDAMMIKTDALPRIVAQASGVAQENAQEDKV